MDIRIGKIIEAEKVEKSKKLLKLKVDTGIDTRTVMSGIAEHFSPESVIGKQVTILVNLAPRKIMGVESQGMILMAEDKDGKLRLLQPSEAVAPGSTVS
jgi:methionyl-tRNA synthetase